jgi:hypothetical protein
MRFVVCLRAQVRDGIGTEFRGLEPKISFKASPAVFLVNFHFNRHLIFKKLSLNV